MRSPPPAIKRRYVVLYPTHMWYRPTSQHICFAKCPPRGRTCNIMSSQNQSSPRRFKIAVIAGDGIGVEISEAAIQVLQKLSDTCGIFAFDFQHLDYSSKNYLERGYYMPEGGLESLQKFDAIYFGAVGWPGPLFPHFLFLDGGNPASVLTTNARRARPHFALEFDPPHPQVPKPIRQRPPNPHPRRDRLPAEIMHRQTLLPRLGDCAREQRRGVQRARRNVARK